MWLKEPCFGGIDPGRHGAICLMWPNPTKPRMLVCDIPIKDRQGTSRVFHDLDDNKLTEIMEKYKPQHMYLEQVWSMAGDGHVGAFSFGANFGAIRGVLSGCHIDRTEVAPALWKAALKVTADKQKSKERAKLLFPKCSKLFKRPDHAEAAMICLYGLFCMGLKCPKDISPLE